MSRQVLSLMVYKDCLTMGKSSPTRDSVTELFTKAAGQANTLTIPRHYIEFCNGDHLAALLLSQILYWTDRTDDPDGWFAKSYEDWYEETCLTKRQIMRIIGKDKRQKKNAFSLKAIGVETAVKRSKHYEGQAAMRYRVNFEVLSQHIHEHLGSKVTNAHSSKVTKGNSLEVTNAHSSKVTKGNSYITETTAKTIAEKKSATLPPHLVAMQNGLNPSLIPYLDQWQQSAAINGVEPPIPSGQRGKMLEDAQTLADMGCTPEYWGEYISERKAKKKSTVWNFALSDVHEFMARKKSVQSSSNVSSIRSDIHYVEETDQTMIFDWEKGRWDTFPGKLESRPA